jgi:phosphoribosyl 1,2-cyclic phosphate phosphodiesterase
VNIEVLGSGGGATTPRPSCSCRVCVEARAKGPPYARTGPSYFVHGPNVLIDTPEESNIQLNRAGIGEIAACFYSHFHPDHTMGRRVFETRNVDWRGWPPEAKEQLSTTVYLPQQVAADARRYLALAEHLEFMEAQGTVRVVELADGEAVELGGWSFQPFRLAEEYVYAFLIEGNGARVLLAPDETNGWEPPDALRGVDLAVIPMGLCEFDPLTGERRLHPEHPLLAVEATFDETLDIVERLAARRTVLSHVEEMDGLSHDDLLEVARRHGGRFEFAYDGMVLDA